MEYIILCGICAAGMSSLRLLLFLKYEFAGKRTNSSFFCLYTQGVLEVIGHNVPAAFWDQLRMFEQNMF